SGSPAEPVNPVNQAKRSSDGGTYSFCWLSARGTRKPVRLRRISSSRNAASRAGISVAASGSSNVWKCASNIAFLLGNGACPGSENRGPPFRDMLALLKFHSRPLRTKAKTRPKLHTIPPPTRSFTKLQSVLGSETDSTLVSKKTIRNSGVEISRCSGSTTRGPPCPPFHSRKYRRRRGLSPLHQLLTRNVAVALRGWSTALPSCGCGRAGGVQSAPSRAK